MDHLLIPTEMFVMWILFTVNVLGLSGVQSAKPSLLVPWLVVYLINFLVCYLIIFTNYYYQMGIDVVDLVFSGVLFNIIWLLVFTVYCRINDHDR